MSRPGACCRVEARDCPNGQVKCRGESPRRRCIRQQWVCDGDNDCGNFWDEDQCGLFA